MGQITSTIRKRLQCRKTFLSFFPLGFSDPKYIAWERGYKDTVHRTWQKELNRKRFASLLAKKQYITIAKLAVGLESKTHLLFAFEKMAIRDAVRKKSAAKMFACGLYDLIYGKNQKAQFEKYVNIISKLPQKQSRVLTWPIVTIFGFIAKPKKFIYLKPLVTKKAATRYGFDFDYISHPNWKTYQSLKKFTGQIRKDLSDLKPKDFIDIQSFIWVIGSEEYE